LSGQPLEVQGVFVVNQNIYLFFDKKSATFHFYVAISRRALMRKRFAAS